MAQRIMDGENSSISGRQRQQPGIVVLVGVHNLRPPSAERLSYLEHPWDGGYRSNPARNDEHPDSLAPEAVDHLFALGVRPPELKRVRAAEYRYVVIDLN